MLKRKCAFCKKVMEFAHDDWIRKFCSRECFNLAREQDYASEDSGPPMKQLTAEDMTDDGFIALVEAIVARASTDVKTLAPGTVVRTDAENFFLSDYFSALTGLDGDTVLSNLQDEYERIRKKKRGYATRKVRCVETGVVYPSIKEAAGIYGVTQKHIYTVCIGEKLTAGGVHWEYAEDKKR